MGCGHPEMTFNGGILVFRAISPIHAGVGSETMHIIDLPIQREKHTGWPTIYGSSIKGALRSYCKNILGLSNNDIKHTFGSEPKDSDKETGSISFSDARLLLFPVKSYSKVFVWITCPLALKRLIEDITLISSEKWQSLLNIEKLEKEKETLDEGKAIVSVRFPEDTVFLEDTKVSVEKVKINLENFLDLEKFSEFVGVRHEMLLERLVVVHDEIFTSFVRNATQIIPRVKLNENKTVDTGPWYEEYLPPETVMYSLVQRALIKLKEDRLKCIRKVLCKLDGRLVNFGGKETTGKGFVLVRYVGDHECKSCTE